MLVAQSPLVGRQSIVNVQRKQMFNGFTIHCEFPIADLQLLRLARESESNRTGDIANGSPTPGSFLRTQPGSEALRLLLATLLTLPLRLIARPCFASRHFDPTWHRV